MQRPTAITVFGILNIVWGLFSCMSYLISGGMLLLMMTQDVPLGSPRAVALEPFSNPLMRAWTGFNFVTGTLAAIALVIAGFGLLRMRPWSRRLSMGYALFAVFSLFVNLVVQAVAVWMPQYEAGQRAGDGRAEMMIFTVAVTIIGASISLIYPVLLWYFMTRPPIVAALGGNLGATGPLPAEVLTPRVASSNPYQAPLAEPSPLGGEVVYAAATSSTPATVVPGQNGPAQVAFYLGLCSIVPCLGLPLGAVAVYYALQGFRLQNENPVVGGGTQAWIGVIAGSLFGLFNLAIFALMLVGMVINAMGLDR